MSLVFAGVCSHAPGITGRADRAEPDLKDGLYASFDRMRDAIKEAEAETLVVVAAEHFANFFMDNMPAYCIGRTEGCGTAVKVVNLGFKVLSRWINAPLLPI